MNIGKIAGYVGVGLLTASCTMKKPATEKAIEHASKYLKGSELYVAETKALNLPIKDNHNYSHDIFYWDSLLSVNREKEYKDLGKKFSCSVSTKISGFFILLFILYYSSYLNS